MNKLQIIGVILKELRYAQAHPWKAPPSEKSWQLVLPPGLPVGSGRQLHATEKLIGAVNNYAQIRYENEIELKARFKVSELNELAQRAFGQKLATIDLDIDDDELALAIKKDVDQLLDDLISRNKQAISLTIGCHLLKGEEAYPIKIGPVIFETLEQWRVRCEADDKISAITSRRLRRRWEESRQRKRQNSGDAMNERTLVEAIGDCPVVCTVWTEGLSSKMISEKALLAARIAMTTLSLMWDNPSQALRWMNLLYDGRTFRRSYTLFRQAGYAGSSSSISQMPDGRWTDAELIAEILEYQDLFDVVGEALLSYVQPKPKIPRADIQNALFLSLWWFHEACREPSDQMATTKFAASMDALSGGKKAGGIVRFIEARFGISADKALMKDGRTTKAVVHSFYDAGRSRLIHGSSDDFAYDWSKQRSAAEAVGRLCLVLACDWIHKNPNVDDLARLSKV